MSRWPPQEQIARELDDVQARMSALILRLRPHPFEGLEKRSVEEEAELQEHSAGRKGCGAIPGLAEQSHGMNT